MLLSLRKVYILAKGPGVVLIVNYVFKKKLMKTMLRRLIVAYHFVCSISINISVIIVM